MGRVARTVSLTEEQDARLDAYVQSAGKKNRSQVIDEALTKFFGDAPVSAPREDTSINALIAGLKEG